MMNKMTSNHEDLYTELLKEQLRRVGTTIERIKVDYPHDGSKKPGGDKWFSDITWSSEEEYESFKKWAIIIISKRRKCSKKRAEKSFSWWDVDVGLRVQE